MWLLLLLHKTNALAMYELKQVHQEPKTEIELLSHQQDQVKLFKHLKDQLKKLVILQQKSIIILLWLNQMTISYFNTNLDSLSGVGVGFKNGDDAL